jgi:hypothetical protein
VEKQLVAKAQSVAEQGFEISRKQLICKAGRQQLQWSFEVQVTVFGIDPLLF